MTKERASANDTGLSRRNLLAALPVSGLAATLPQAGPAQTPDPAVIAYAEWIEARRECNRLAYTEAHESMDTPEYIEADKRERRAEIDLLEAVPTSLAGIGALAAFAWTEVRPQTTDPEQFEWLANNHRCQSVLAIWRACTGQEGYPHV